VYVRAKHRRRGKKTFGPWWQVVKSHRTSKGKLRQKVVANIGAADSKEQADALARQMGLLCAMAGCPEQPTEWAGYGGLYLTTKRNGIEYGARVCSQHLDEFQAAYRAMVEEHASPPQWTMWPAYLYKDDHGQVITPSPTREGA
jgi:hypothetical protein